MTGVMRPLEDWAMPKAGDVADCPYKGLTPYTERDAAYFFGRDRDREVVVANLRASRLTLLYGPSGVGKSSLLQAGVLRQLHGLSGGSRAPSGMRPVIAAYHASWRDDPLVGLAAALRDALPDQLPDQLVADDLVPANVSLSVELLRHVTRQLNANVVLVCDQFEEVAVYQTGVAADAFAAELGRIIAATDVRVAVLLGIREDALARLDRFEEDIPGVFDNLLPLNHLDLAAARQAIEQPVLRYNTEVPADRQVSVEAELVDELLPRLRTGCVSVVEAGQGDVERADVDDASARIETPFLQLVMTRLWSEEAARGSRTLHRSTLDELGGAEQIVRTHLDSVMSQLSDDQQEVAARIFRYLVTRSGMKIAYTAEDLADCAGIEDRARVTDVLERLSAGRERVLRPVPPPLDQPGAPRYEIFHDVMAPAVLDWRRRRQHVESERVLVAAKHEAEERDRRTRRQLRRSRLLSATLALLLLAVLGLGYWVKRSHDDAQHREQLAVFEQQLHSDPATSLHAALRAWQTRHSSEAESAVRIALAASTQRRVLHGHRGAVNASQFAPGGRTVLTAGQDGTAKLFAAGDGRLLRTFAPEGGDPGSPLTGASFSPDGSMLVTAAMNGRVQVYDTATGRRRATLVDYADGAFATWGRLQGRPVVLTYGWDGTPALWDPVTPNRPIAQYGTSTGTNGADLSPDGRYVVTLVTVGSDAIARVWEAATGRLVASSPALGNVADQSRFVAAGSGRVAVLAKESWLWQVAFWDWRGRVRIVKRADWEARESSELAVSSDGRFVAAGLDKQAIVFNAETGQTVGSSPDQADWVTAVDFSPDGRWLVTGGNDGRTWVSIADQHNAHPVDELLGHRGAVTDARFDPRNPSVVTTAGSDGTARTWETPGRIVLPGAGDWILDADVSRDGRHVVTTEDIGWLRVWRSDGRLERKWFDERSERLQRARFTPDGTQVVATATDAYSPFLWTWRGRNEPVRLEASDYALTPDVAISSDGRTAAVGDRANRVILWDLNTHKITGRLGRLNSDYAIWDVAYIPGSPLLAVASGDGRVQIWDPRDPSRPKRILDAPGGAGILDIDVSDDGTHLVTAAEDRTLRVWNVSDGQLAATIPGPGLTIGDVTFSPDASLLAVGAADGAVHMWRWRDQNPREFVLQRHGDMVNTVALTGDGKNIITASDDSTAAIYPCTVCGSFRGVLRDAEQREKLHGRF